MSRQPFTSSMFSRYGTGNGSALTQKDYLSEYKNWVFPCVQARSEEVGNIELKLYKGDKLNNKEILNHPLLDLLNRVNDYTTKFQLFSATQAFKDLHGNSFWYLARAGKDGKGDIQEIYLMRPDKVRIVISKENPLQVLRYEYTQPDGKIIPFTPEEILHHKEFSPTANHPFPHLGMGIVQAAAYAIDTDNEARTWNLNFFRNSARPDGILYTDGEGALDADSTKRMKEEWNEEHGGSERAHKTAVLSGGLKWQEITRSQKDMDFIQQKIQSRDEILALFRTPKSIVGITDDVNRANADASVYIFALRTVKPLMQKLVDTLNEFLVPEYGDDLFLSFKSPVPDDRAEIVDEYTKGYGVWLTRNEIRAKEGLLPTENGDQFLESNLLTVVDEAKPAKKQLKKIVKKSEPEKPEEEKSEAEKLVEKFTAKLPKSDKKTLSVDAKSAYIQSWIKRTDDHSNAFKRKMIDYFTKQEAEVQSNLRDEMKGLEAKEYKLKAVSDIIFDQDKAVKAGINLITPFIRQYIKDSGEAGNTAANGEGFSMATETISKFITDRSKFFAENINDTTADQLLASIQDGVNASETLEEISARIAGIYDQAKNYRTDMIARTEVSASSNFGAIEGYKQAGVEKHQWAVVDPQDEDCKEDEGAIVKIGDAFPSGAIQPPDPHPNCMCTTLPVFDDSEE